MRVKFEMLPTIRTDYFQILLKRTFFPSSSSPSNAKSLVRPTDQTVIPIAMVKDSLDSSLGVEVPFRYEVFRVDS